MRGLNSSLIFPITPPKQAMPLFEAVFVPQVNGEIDVSLAMVRLVHTPLCFPGSLRGVKGLGRAVLLP